MNISMVRSRFRKFANTKLYGSVIRLSGGNLPTSHPVGAYIASQGSTMSKSSMETRLAAALCVMEEKMQLKYVSDEKSRFYHAQVWQVHWAEITRDWMFRLCDLLGEVGYAVSTRKMTLTAVTQVLAECRITGMMSSEAYFRATENLPKIRGTSVPRGRAVSPDEITAMYRVFDQDPKPARGIRDAAVFALGLVCGLRGGEVVRLEMSDYSRLDGTLLIHGKGNKVEHVPIMGFAQARLEDWLDVRGPTPGGVFTRLDAAGNIMMLDRKTGMRRLVAIKGRNFANRMLAYRTQEAGLLEPLKFHDLRRTTGTAITDVSSLKVAQSLLRHADIKTTARYQMLDQHELRDAMSERDRMLKDVLNGSGRKSSR